MGWGGKDKENKKQQKIKAAHGRYQRSGHDFSDLYKDCRATHAPLQRGFVCVCVFVILTFSIQTAGSSVKALRGDPVDP